MNSNDKKVLKYKHLPTFRTQYLLIGGGIMSATLATLIRKVKHYSEGIVMIERLPECGKESSDSLNNAGTGHAGYCELNYTPMDEQGNIDISKAVKVNKAFRKSVEFWNYLKAEGTLSEDIYHNVPHYSFVVGKDNVEYLRKRHAAMKKDVNFGNLLFTDDEKLIEKELPLIGYQRYHIQDEPYAITKSEDGLDVDYGLITKQLIDKLRGQNFLVENSTEVVDIYRKTQYLPKEDNLINHWMVVVKDLNTGKLSQWAVDKHVFIGAGGAAITLLEKSGIPEAKGYGGFPVSGEWLICDNPEVVNKHNAKVYGMPTVGAPPMSVPHLDTRIINGKKCLLFGPFAAMSTKFLKNGSYTDFFKSIRLDNIGVLIDAGARNMSLNKYLVKELLKGHKARIKELEKYYPLADEKDWKMAVAGQRVQIIKKVNGKGVIEFGTEIVSSKEGELSALLGASPGASTSVKIMIDLMEKCFNLTLPEKIKIAEMIPSYDEKLVAELKNI
jgi:malate dehydrogenase (quinone)